MKLTPVLLSAAL